MVKGDRAYLEGLNIVGLKRRKFEKNEITNLMNFFKSIFESNDDDKTLEERIKVAANDFSDSEAVQKVIKFLQNDSSRSLCLPK